MAAAAERAAAGGVRAMAASTSAGCRRSPWPASWSPPAGSAHSATSAGLPGQPPPRPEFPLVWRLQAERGGLGRARRPRRPRHRPRPVPGRGPDRRGLGADRDLRAGTAPVPTAAWAAGAGHRRRRGAVHRPFRRRGPRRLRGDPLRHRPHRGPAGRAQRRAGQHHLGARRPEPPAPVRRHRGPGDPGVPHLQVTRAGHPYAGAWWPDGHTIGYEHTFTHEVRDLLHAIADGRDPVPSFADGLQVQEVLDAVQRSAASGAGWTKVGR